MNRFGKQLGFALLFLVLGWAACMLYFYSTRTELLPGLVKVTVKKLLDGDSGKFSGGREFRIVGIDAPEKGTRFADAARDFAKKLLEGKTVFLETATEPKDRYNRVLGWLWIDTAGERRLANAEIIRAGHAFVYMIKPNVKYFEQLVAAQREARAAKRGVWSVERLRPEKEYITCDGLTHRPSCGKMKKAHKKKTHFKTFDEAVDTGAPPCRACRP